MFSYKCVGKYKKSNVYDITYHITISIVFFLPMAYKYNSCAPTTEAIIKTADGPNYLANVVH